MTQSLCDQVTERVALGESLGELAGHAATCSSCARLVAMSSQLGATHHAVDPGLGFSARMTVGAQHRLALRRRHRLAAGLAASVAGGALAVLLVTHTPAVVTTTGSTGSDRKPVHEEGPTPATDDELTFLVQMADVDRASRVSARWGHIKKPLAPYKKLIEGVTP